MDPRVCVGSPSGQSPASPIMVSDTPGKTSSFCSTTRAHRRKTLNSVYNHPAVKIPEGVPMPSLGNALQELRKDRDATQSRLEKLNQIISGIESLKGGGAATPGNATKPKRILSTSARRRISLAQKARWASVRKNSQPTNSQPTVVAKTGAAPAKRIMSASARRKIAAAQKARWAKFRAQKKAA
jgi:hypothetical protein